MGILKGRSLGACVVAACSALACGNGRLDAFESAPSGPIDDFEDLNTQAAFGVGWWFITNDGSGTQTMEVVAPGDRLGDLGALHSTGGPFTDWGAIVGVNLAGTGAGGGYDASRFTSLRFFAKAGPGSQTATSACFLSGDTCFSHGVTLDSAWSEYTIPLASASNADDPMLRLDASQIRCLQFGLSGTGIFDLWLDDVAFVRQP